MLRKIFLLAVRQVAFASLSVLAAAQTVTAPPPSGTSNSVPKFSGPTTIVNSGITEVSGNVGIGTAAPADKLHVAGNVLLTAPSSLQILLAGSTLGRIGQDGLGTFLSADSVGKDLRFYTTNGVLTERARFKSNGLFSLTPNKALYGEVIIGRANDDSVAPDQPNTPNQALDQMRIRLSRACPTGAEPSCDQGVGGPLAKHLYIGPYSYGMQIEYPGTFEMWNRDFSVHNNHTNCDSTNHVWNDSRSCESSASFWVGDRWDVGGLNVQAYAGPSVNFAAPNPIDHTVAFVALSAQNFTRYSHGSMHFQVRELPDGFRFQFGPSGAEVTKVRFDWAGKGYFNGGTQTGGADFAEAISVGHEPEPVGPGDVLAIDTSGDRRVVLSRRAFARTVAGVYSTKPGVLATPYPMDAPELNSQVPLAIIGIVPCKVSAENGRIRPGDLLVSSNTAGHAMRAGDIDPSALIGAVLGKALGSLDSGTGLIEVLLLPH